MSENNRNLNKEYQTSSSEHSAASNPSDVAAQLQKIQTHLGFLEKKLDLLLAQQPQPRSGGFGGGGHRPSGGGRGGDFRPRRPFGGGRDFRGGRGGDRPDRGGEGRPSREGRPPMREGRGGGEDRPREFRGGHGGGGFKKKPRHF